MARFKIDLFPPGSFDPQSLHGLLWPRFGGQEYQPPQDNPLTFAAYNAEGLTCYVEPTAVGKTLVDMPLFISPGHYVNVPLEPSYLSAWEAMPVRWKNVIDGTA